MVRRKLISGVRSILQATRLSTQPAPIQHLTAEQSRSNLKYIDERVNNVFNIILADINAKNTHPPARTPTTSLYNDPYNCKDRILQDLVANHEINQNYNIHDMIEEEFQLEISDNEFNQFKSLGDVVKYVNHRLEIKSMFTHDNGHSSTNLTY